jgi:hypothetical protein
MNREQLTKSAREVFVRKYGERPIETIHGATDYDSRLERYIEGWIDSHAENGMRQRPASQSFIIRRSKAFDDWYERAKVSFTDAELSSLMRWAFFAGEAWGAAERVCAEDGMRPQKQKGQWSAEDYRRADDVHVSRWSPPPFELAVSESHAKETCATCGRCRWEHSMDGKCPTGSVVRK